MGLLHVKKQLLTIPFTPKLGHSFHTQVGTVETISCTLFYVKEYFILCMDGRQTDHPQGGNPLDFTESCMTMTLIQMDCRAYEKICLTALAVDFWAR